MSLSALYCVNEHGFKPHNDSVVAPLKRYRMRFVAEKQSINSDRYCEAGFNTTMFEHKQDFSITGEI